MVREAKIVGLGKDQQMSWRAGIPVAPALACPTSALETGSSRVAAVASGVLASALAEPTIGIRQEHGLAVAMSGSQPSLT